MILEIGQLEETRIWLDLPNGDLILKQIADRLMQKMREGDIVVRLGEACFLWSLPAFHKVEDIAAVAEKILADVAVPMEIQGKEVSLKGSIGISLFPTDGDDPDLLVSFAAAALDQSRELTRSSFTFYSSEINEETRSKLLLKNELKEAVGKQEFALHYQPVVEIASDEVEGMEALIRWRKPLGQTVYPGQFLDFTEEIGLAANLDEWVIRTACNQRNTWEKEGLGRLRLRVNLSSQFFWDRAIDRLSRVLETVDIDPDLLELEINEKTIVKDPEKAIIILDQLRSAGARLAIDDFGSGGLSLFHLRHYPVQTVKIDPSFIRGINSQSPNAAAIYAAMSMAKSMKIRVIAEGVESQSELQFLRTMGCDGYQGNYFSPALPRSLFSELIKKQRVHPVESPPVTAAAAKVVAVNAPAPPPAPASKPRPVSQPAPQASSASAPYLISCFHCHTRLNALDADWCLCLTSDQTIVCPQCGKCFCKAPLEFGQSVWERAP
ncbi:MAG TPA: bifunctional diguanylate cyclase/phosphodiesterase, partial [Acidobacteriota bacterium]|nr:bifunctional diguanylate cyclase/phosphodiesterase [Acidobacteriota bacterium]